jgi:hypothetical protein
LLTEYIQRALQFQELAERETDPEFKAELLKQANAYRQLAANGPKSLGSGAKLTEERN